MFVSTPVLAAQPVDAGAPAAEEADNGAANAQGQAEAPAKTGQLLPPAVIDQPELVHPLPPADARALGEVTVVVLVDIDARGVVVGAALDPNSAPVGPELLAAALQTASATRFSPATKDGVAVPVRLPMALKFVPPEPASTEQGDGASEQVAAEAEQQGVGLVEEEGAEAPLASADDGTKDGASLAAQPAIADPFAPEDEGGWGGLTALGQTSFIAGSLVLGSALAVSLFTGASTLDGADRVEATAEEDPDLLAEVEQSRTYGNWMLIPVVGPVGAVLNAPDATTRLITIVMGAGQVVGLVAMVVGGSLWVTGALIE